MQANMGLAITGNGNSIQEWEEIRNSGLGG
jgi:hypothetical protein